MVGLGRGFYPLSALQQCLLFCIVAGSVVEKSCWQLVGMVGKCVQAPEQTLTAGYIHYYVINNNNNNNNNSTICIAPIKSEDTEALGLHKSRSEVK